jgi:hypothetical protein
VIAEGDADREAHHRAVNPVFHFNGEPRPMEGVREALFAEEAMRFMAADRDQPFFLLSRHPRPSQGLLVDAALRGGNVGPPA